jgi:hypothetical protein
VGELGVGGTFPKTWKKIKPICKPSANFYFLRGKKGRTQRVSSPSTEASLFKKPNSHLSFLFIQRDEKKELLTFSAAALRSRLMRPPYAAALCVRLTQPPYASALPNPALPNPAGVVVSPLKN